MAFCLTFDSVISNNIKNVYSGGRDYQIRPLMKKDHTTLNHLKRRTSAPRVDKDLLRKSVYMSNYRCYVPAAPAFNDVTRDEMLEIVERVRRPTEATQTRDARGDRNAIRPGNSSNDLAPKSQEDVNAIFTRVQRHTHMSRLRTVRHVANQPDRELTDVDI